MRIARSWLGIVLPLSAALLACASATHAPDKAPSRPRFVFQNGFWVNLHHFLRAEARRQERGAELALALATLDEEEREAWMRALDRYRPVAQRSLLFDEEMVRLHVALASGGGSGALPGGLADPELGAALEAAAPVFREHVWPARARANDEWIERTRPEIERLELQVTDALAAAHQLEWPAQPILVDVTPETGPNAAYTTSTAPPGFAGLATINPSIAAGSADAIECVFHEAAHVLDATLVRWVEEECARQGVPVPRDLWHALLFYTAGELTARALGEAGTYRADLEQIFPAFLSALDAHWRPYLDGRLARNDALRELVRAATSGGERTR